MIFYTYYYTINNVFNNKKGVVISLSIGSSSSTSSSSYDLDIAEKAVKDASELAKENKDLRNEVERLKGETKWITNTVFKVHEEVARLSQRAVFRGIQMTLLEEENAQLRTRVQVLEAVEAPRPPGPSF